MTEFEIVVRGDKLVGCMVTPGGLYPLMVFEDREHLRAVMADDEAFVAAGYRFLNEVPAIFRDAFNAKDKDQTQTEG